MLVDEGELEKIEAKHGRLPRTGKDKLKWLIPPDWRQETFDAVIVEIPESKAEEIFKEFRVKLLRKK